MRFVILSIVQIAETHVGSIPKFCWPLLEVSMHQFQKCYFLIETAECIIFASTFFGWKTEVCPVKLFQCLAESPIASGSSAHFGCHKWILANTSNSDLIDETFVFLNRALIKFHLFKISDEANCAWGRTWFCILILVAFGSVNLISDHSHTLDSWFPSPFVKPGNHMRHWTTLGKQNLLFVLPNCQPKQVEGAVCVAPFAKSLRFLGGNHFEARFTSFSSLSKVITDYEFWSI